MLKKILAAIGVTLTLIAGPASGGSDHVAVVDHARAAPERCDVAVPVDLGALVAAELARTDQ
jgi:hypothetical protein